MVGLTPRRARLHDPSLTAYSLRSETPGKKSWKPQKASHHHDSRHKSSPRLLRRFESSPSVKTTLTVLVMSAEHVKWGTHLVGSAQLVAELDFPSLTQEARRMRAAKTARESNFPYQNPNMLIDQKQLDQSLKDGIMMPDEKIISIIVGQTVSYDDYGKVFEDVDMNQDKKRGFQGKLDARTFGTLEDLYWFYLRQDAFQSMVSGNPLM